MESYGANPKGVGGWLIVFALGLVIGILSGGYSLATDHLPIFSDGTWSELTTAGTGAYHPLWAPFILFEIVGNILLIVLSVVTLVCLFKESKQTPRFAIILLALSAAFVIADSFIGRLIPAFAEQPDTDSFREIARSLLGAAVWIPYFLFSKRVKATFVE